jgi:hypothetical protein
MKSWPSPPTSARLPVIPPPTPSYWRYVAPPPPLAAGASRIAPSTRPWNPAHAARLSRLVFATPDPKAGYAGTLHNTPADARLNHTLPVEGGLLAESAAVLLRDFFQNRRRKP